jgi:hypothetical protein
MEHAGRSEHCQSVESVIPEISIVGQSLKRL